MDEQTEEMRAEFEHWVSEGGKYPRAAARDRNENYILASSYMSFKAFSAGWRAHGSVKDSLTVDHED